MRIVFKPYLLKKIRMAINEACVRNIEIDKIVVTKDEARQLEVELGQGPILGFKNNTLYGLPLEVEE